MLPAEPPCILAEVVAPPTTSWDWLKYTGFEPDVCVKTEAPAPPAAKNATAFALEPYAIPNCVGDGKEISPVIVNVAFVLVDPTSEKPV